jgi:hypothetical protein
MSQPSAQLNYTQHESLWLAALQIMLMTAITGALAWLVALIVLMFTLGFGGVLAGSIWGFCVGVVQKQALKKWLPSSDWSRWHWSTILGATCGWLSILCIMIVIVLADLPVRRAPLSLLLVVPFMISGAMLGLLQWRAAPHKMGTTWWIVANALGWGISVFIGMNIAEQFMPIIPAGGRLYGPDDVVNDFVSGVICLTLFSVIMVLPMRMLLGQFVGLSRNGDARNHEITM